jgi:hypothetical protein
MNEVQIELTNNSIIGEKLQGYLKSQDITAIDFITRTLFQIFIYFALSITEEI